MTDINPTYRKQVPPTLTELLDAHKRDVKTDFFCCRVGVIQAFYPGSSGTSATVDVLIAQQQVTSVQPNGAQTLAPYPLLKNVPVQFPSGGGFNLTFPINVGDECLLLFQDRELDNWLLAGVPTNGNGPPPTTGRMHDISDAIAIVGVRSNPRALSNISTTSTQLRSDDGQTYIDLAAGKIQLVANEVIIHGRNKTVFDAGGTGFVYTPAQIDTYTDGVTSNHHSPNPPEVPT